MTHMALDLSGSNVMILPSRPHRRPDSTDPKQNDRIPHSPGTRTQLTEHVPVEARHSHKKLFGINEKRVIYNLYFV